MKHVYYYDFPIGKLAIADNSETITHITTHDGFNKEEYQFMETPPYYKSLLTAFRIFRGKKKNL